MIRKTLYLEKMSKILLDSTPQHGECPFTEMISEGHFYVASYKCMCKLTDSECMCIEHSDDEFEYFDFDKCKFCTSLGKYFQNNGCN